MPKYFSHIIFFSFLLMFLVLSPGCSQEQTKELSTITVSKQDEHEKKKSGLSLQFQDDFSKEYGPPDYFDMTRWSKRDEAQSRVENGYWFMDILKQPPPSPGLASLDLSYGGYSTTEKTFNPGLVGTNGVEITLEDFIHEKVLPKEKEAPKKIVNWTQDIDHCFSLTIANSQGWITDDTHRGVQVHFDFLKSDGVFVYLVRGLVPEDYEKYPKDGYTSDHSRPQLSVSELRELHEKEMAHGGAFISEPSLALSSRVYRTEEEIQDIMRRSHRWGLYLTNDANTVYWTLDNQVMDTADISGYFHSAPDSVKDGAFLTIMGLGTYQQNTWKMDDLEIFGSP